jgi:hypothetical protein
MTESRHERFNTHTEPPLEAEGVPEEEELSAAQADDQVEQDPDEIPNAPNDPDLKDRATVDEPGVQRNEGGRSHP